MSCFQCQELTLIHWRSMLYEAPDPYILLLVSQIRSCFAPEQNLETWVKTLIKSDTWNCRVWVSTWHTPTLFQIVWMAKNKLNKNLFWWFYTQNQWHICEESEFFYVLFKKKKKKGSRRFFLQRCHGRIIFVLQKNISVNSSWNCS